MYIEVFIRFPLIIVNDWNFESFQLFTFLKLKHLVDLYVVTSCFSAAILTYDSDFASGILQVLNLDLRMSAPFSHCEVFLSKLEWCIIINYGDSRLCVTPKKVVFRTRVLQDYKKVFIGLPFFVVNDPNLNLFLLFTLFEMKHFVEFVII